VIAAEMGIFNLEADLQGNYAVRTAEGFEIRLIVVNDAKLLVEGKVLGGICQLVRNPEAFFPVLHQNFSRSILNEGTLSYQRDRDELVLVDTFFIGQMEEAAIVSRIEAFLVEISEFSEEVQQILRPTPVGSMPTNSSPIT
jgi:hypothetical protein